MGAIVGLGQAGCNIAKLYSQYPQYEVFYIDSEAREEENFLKITKQDSHELYDTKTRLKKSFTLTNCKNVSISLIRYTSKTN